MITELPYQVNKADLLTKILALREDKKDLLAGIAEIVDESDKEGVRAVVRIKKDYDPKKFWIYFSSTQTFNAPTE